MAIARMTLQGSAQVFLGIVSADRLNLKGKSQQKG